jgi:hypothetical protein
VAQTGGGYVVVSQTNGVAKQLTYDANAKFTSSLPVPPVGMTHARGYSGAIAFYQLIEPGAQDSAAEFEVREVDGPGDTVGVSVLKRKLNWLRLRDSRPVVPVPLFATLPSYALAPDGDIVWSNSDVFNVERRSAKGALRWSLTSDVPGPAITPAHLKELRSKLPQDDKARLAAFDSSAAHTGKFFPAASGLFVGADGSVLVVGPQTPMRDSLDFTVLNNGGAPIGRFSLPVRTRPLLYGGDSLLVQRPGANANSELRWLVLNKKP